MNESTTEIYISGISANASCDGAATGSITLTVSGGEAPYFYSWSNGSDEKDQMGLAAGLYDVIVTDANDCSAAWYASVGEEVKASLSGIARFSKGTVDAEDADVVLLDASEHPFKEVEKVRMQNNGYFEFTDIQNGIYVVYVKLDNHAKQKYPGVMHSYYNNTYKWSDAQIISLGCEEQSIIDLEMFENPAATKVGSGKAGGTVTYNNGLIKAYQPPVINAVVMLIDDSNGLPVDYVVTDTYGNYELNNIANGNYSVYVDIAGLTQVSMHQFSITDFQFEYLNMDFEVDIIVNMAISKIESTDTGIDQYIGESSVFIYPNPAANFVYLRSSLFVENNIVITLYSQSGALISIYKYGEYEHLGDQIKIDLPEMSSGYYILKTEVNGIVRSHKIIVNI